MMLRLFSLTCILLTLPPLAGLCSGQVLAPGGATVTPSLSARSAAPGQQVVLSYQITGAQSGAVEYPQTIEVPGLSVVFSGQSQRSVAVNGVVQVQIGLRYMVQSSEAGEYQIPAQTFKVNGMEMQAAAVTMKISEGEPVSDKFLPTVQLTLGRTEFWIGEIVPVQVAVLVHPAVQPLGQFFPQVKTPNFAVNRFDRSGGMEAREVNGEIWRAWQVESVLSALQPGVHDVGPAEIKTELLIPEPGMLNDPFLGRQQGNRRNVTLTSNKVKVNVKELPMEGKPTDFTGAVGDFQITLQASPLVLKAGDPIALEIAVDGSGNFDAVTVPRPLTTDGWRLYEARVGQENRGWGTEPGRKSFIQILIPEKNQTEIPPFVLSFFDPRSGKYVSRQSQPIALTVTGEFKAASSATGDSRDFAAPPDASAPTEELGDILDQPLGSGAWFSTAATPLPTNPILLHGVPALLLSLLIGTGIVRRVRAAAAARRPAAGTPRELFLILADLRQGQPDRRSFYRLVNEYLTSAQFHLGRQPASGEALGQVMLARDRWLYGPEEAATQETIPPEERVRTLEVLSKL